MVDHEESEIIQDFGNITRTILGSGLQAAEQAQRRASMKQAEASAQDVSERAVAGQEAQNEAPVYVISRPGVLAVIGTD